MDLFKGQLIEIQIEKIIPGGEGLGHYNDFAIFVPMSVPRDLLQVKIISLKKTYGRALIEKIIQPSKERIKDTEKISYEDFQGCDFGMLKYDAQLKYKKLIVEDVLSKIGKMENILVTDVIGADNPYNYRNKIIEPFKKINNQIITGFFKRKSHEVFQVEENILNSQLGNKIIKELKKLLNQNKISVYDEESGQGLLRHIMVRTNSKNEAMIVLIINNNKVHEKCNNILKELKRSIKNIKSLYISLNNKNTNVALGKENILIDGDKIITEEINNIKFNISPLSFFQINLPQTKKLYNTAIGFLDNIQNKTIVDAYSGTGTIAMILSQRAKKIFAIEVISSATKDGILAAKENNIKNIEFINGKVEEKLPEIIKNKEKIDAIIFDPPRKGIEETSLLAVSQNNIKEIVYISCNPSTFARDVKILSDNGYQLKKVQPVDMFPFTSHVEVIGKLVKIDQNKF